MLNAAAQWIGVAGHNDQTVAVAATSEGGREIVASNSAHTLEHLRAIKPQPYLPDHMALLPAIENFLHAWPKADIVWIADGLEAGHARQFAEELAKLAPKLTLIVSDQASYALAGPKNEGGFFEIRVLRSNTKGPAQGIVRALDRKGLTLGQVEFRFQRAFGGEPDRDQSAVRSAGRIAQ